MESSEFFEDDIIRFRIEDGILFTYYRKGASIDLDGAKKIVQNRLHLLNGRVLPMILLDEGIKEVKREARIYLSEGEGVQGISACAFIVTNPFTKVVVQFFLALNAKSNAFPVKTFSAEEDGLKWLEAYK
jgi:hypothetical protein